MVEQKQNTKKKFTFKQQKFIDNYCGVSNGNATDAARKAGYKGNEDTLKQVACQNLTKVYIKEEIDRILSQKKADSIANRQQRQRFWSRMMNGELDGISVSNSDRLKASELLGKSEADFTDNVNTTDTQRQRELNDKEKQECAELARIRLGEKYGVKTKVGT